MSNPSEMIFKEEARLKLKSGIAKLAETIKPTLGPGGKNVGIHERHNSPEIVNDGNSIISKIDFKDQYMNMGASLAKELSSKIKQEAGDGTTTGILLLDAIVQAGIKNISAGSSPISIKKGIEEGVSQVIQNLKKLSTPLESDEEIKHIAAVSAHGNKKIGEYIFNALRNVNKTGVVTVEDGSGRDTKLEVVDGLRFERGYASPYFCSDMESMSLEQKKPSILITDKKISSIHDILPALQAASAIDSELLIIADEFNADVISSLVVNKVKGTLKVCAVKTPGYGDRKKELLLDIACLTGAKCILEDQEMQFKDIDQSFFGTAEKIIITKDHTTIVNGGSDPSDLELRIHSLETQIKNTNNKSDKEFLKQRKAKLSGGVAVIRVGAPSEKELKIKKQLFEASLNATRAALQSGFLPGGGIALLFASRDLDPKNLSDEEKIGLDILTKACEAPFKQLVSNTCENQSIALEEVLAKGFPFGFNLQSSQIEDMIKSSVIDPASLSVLALRHAASTACIVLLSEVLIGELKEE